METTNAIGMVSCILSQSPRSSVLSLGKTMCSKWKAPSTKDDSLGTTIEWKKLFRTSLQKGELFEALYYSHLLFTTRKTLIEINLKHVSNIDSHRDKIDLSSTSTTTTTPSRYVTRTAQKAKPSSKPSSSRSSSTLTPVDKMRKNPKLHIWFVLLELTSKHWFIYQLFSIAMTPIFLFKPMTFDMINLAIHLYVTGSLTHLKRKTTLTVDLETSDISIPLDIVKWVGELENKPISEISSCSGVSLIPEDSFWLTVSDLYNVDESVSTESTESTESSSTEGSDTASISNETQDPTISNETQEPTISNETQDPTEQTEQTGNNLNSTE